MTHDSPEFAHIRLEHEENLTWIVLDRPERANALSNELLDGLSSALDWLTSHGGPVLAIRGEGRGFSGGFDLHQVAPDKRVDTVADLARLQRNLDRFLAIWDHPKPIIGAVHGYCVAGATQLVTLTDITIVTEDAKIGNVTVPVGAGYVTPVMSTLIGPKRAKELAFVTGNSIDGRTAVEWGWANHAVPADALLDAVRSLAARIALTPPDLLTLKKSSINKAAEAMGHRHALAHVAQYDALAHTTQGVLEVKKRIADRGLRHVIDEFRVPSTSDLSHAANRTDK